MYATKMDRLADRTTPKPLQSRVLEVCLKSSARYSLNCPDLRDATDSES